LGGDAGSAAAGQWDRLVARYPWPRAEALSVLLCESRGDPAAYRHGNYGLFQINAIHAWRTGGDLAALFDPETNVRVAFDVWRDNAGWRPWACKP
jgi:soluble lytic murein transglycosylase-like protein